MKRLENKEEITMIIMKPVAYTICDIGGDMFKSELEINFVPGECYPDYIEVERWIAENIDGKRLNIEQVVDQVYQFLSKTYRPEHLRIDNTIHGCRTHFDVVVIKE